MTEPGESIEIADYVPLIGLAIVAAGVGDMWQSLGLALAVFGGGLLVAVAFRKG